MKLDLIAPAKINLTLEVLGKREDGYHEIVTIIQTIDLADEIAISSDEPKLGTFSRDESLEEASFGKRGQIHLFCNQVELLKPDNLAVKAALLMQEEFGNEKELVIVLRKHIPLAAGLGGGSSNAATVLLGLSRIWSLDVSRERLSSLGSRLGSDVPFFLYGGACLAEGRGEKIGSLHPFAPFWVVLLKPHYEVTGKTGRVYSALKPEDFSRGEASERLIGISATGGKLHPSLLFNVFDAASQRVFPNLDYFHQTFIDAGAGDVHLTGSGPTLFSLAESEDQARKLCAQLKDIGMEAYWAKSLNELSPISGELVSEPAMDGKA